MKKSTNWMGALLAMAFSTQTVVQAAELIAETPSDYQQRMEWFTDAKFGLFIHFGLYSILGGEWDGKPVERYAEWIQRWGKISPEEYIPLAAQFNPTELDADAWVKAAKEAGMNYMVITTKHHEGFCLWDSALTEYDVGEGTAFDRDILGELAAACEKYGLEFGTYYSIIDWHHLSQRAELATNQPPMHDKAGYVAYMKGQLKELIERYHPSVMWFDGDWVKWWTMEDGTDLYNYLRELDPNLIVNNRVAKRKVFKKDFGTPENFTPGAALDHNWEACWTVNHSWGFKKSDTTWKPTDVLVQKQVDINSKGGNLLLNIGPQSNGAWPAASIGQLSEMGAWNAAHHEAVYGAEFTPVVPPTWGTIAQVKGSTAEAGELFVYVFDWPEDGKCELKHIRFDSVEAFTYDGQPLPITQLKSRVEIDLTQATAHKHATVLRLKYTGMQPLEPLADEIELTGDELILPARAAKINGRTLSYKDGQIQRWTKPTENLSWALNVPAPGTYRVKALISCAPGAAGSDAALSVDGHHLTVKVPSTKGWDQFEALDFGEVTLNQVGATTCTLGFGPKRTKQLFNLKALYFEPVGN